jgi:hypothetical protein
MPFIYHLNPIKSPMPVMHTMPSSPWTLDEAARHSSISSTSRVMLIAEQNRTKLREHTVWNTVCLPFLFLCYPYASVNAPSAYLLASVNFG